MIPFDTRLCELLEAVMAKEPENKYLQYLTDTTFQLMMQTNRIYQNNLDIWSDDRLKMYGLRVNKYGSITQSLTSIKNGNPTIEILDSGIRDGNALYNEINFEFSPEWNNSGNERRREILEEVLLPHMLIIRFLENYKKTKLNKTNSDESFKFHKDKKHSGHDTIIQFFRRNKFGTNNPVMTYLSILDTTDRCVILEELYNPTTLDSILSDKLLLAYVSSGKKHLAEKVIENSIRKGENDMNVWGLRSKLELGLAPSRNREQRLTIYNDFLSRAQDKLEIEFLRILIDFCNNYYE